jgi:hypothetical protein
MADNDEQRTRKLQIGLEDLAAAFGYTATQFKDELALWGWTFIMDEATRLSHVDRWNRNSALTEKERTLEAFVTWENLRDATQQFIPSKIDNPVPVNRHEGWLYVLHDGNAELCKIGCTASGTGKRQRALIGAHGVPLRNVLNAKVNDRFAAEKLCHEHFHDRRRNGEWFAVGPDEVVTFIRDHVNCIQIEEVRLP